MLTQDQMMTSAEVGKVLGITAEMVRVLAKTGRIHPAITTESGLRLFAQSEVDRVAAERRARAQQKERAREGGRAVRARRPAARGAAGR
jgi:DNA-binding transcriptional MerR regulator